MNENKNHKETGMMDRSEKMIYDEDILELDSDTQILQNSRYGVVMHESCVVEHGCQRDPEWMVLFANGNILPLSCVADRSCVVGTFQKDANQYLTALCKRRILGI